MASKDVTEDQANRVFMVFICIAASLVAISFVNIYAGSRQEDGFRYGYIAGYAESKAELPNRLQFSETSPKKELK